MSPQLRESFVKQLRQIVCVFSTTQIPFLYSTEKPKCFHTGDLNVSGGSAISVLWEAAILHTLATECDAHSQVTWNDMHLENSNFRI